MSVASATTDDNKDGNPNPTEHDWNMKCCNAATSPADSFTGYWLRDNAKNQNLEEALLARGLDPVKAAEEAIAPYRQHWSLVEVAENHDSATNKGQPLLPLPLPAWQVVTYAKDNVTPRRTLVYQWGAWDESYQGQATLFGASASNGQSSNTLHRRTYAAPQQIVDSTTTKTTTTVAHITMTKTPKGDLEESRRYREGPYLVLKRTYWKDVKTDINRKPTSNDDDDDDDGVVSYEYFAPDNDR